MTRKLLIFLFTFQVSVVFAQSKKGKLIEIQKQIQAINEGGPYQLKTLENEQFLDRLPDGGGALTGYLKENKVCKMTERLGKSYCVQQLEYYFVKEQLIFVNEKELDFALNDSSGFDYASQTLSFECCYYFDQGKLIASKTIGKKAIEYDTNEDKEKVFLANAKRLAELLKK